MSVRPPPGRYIIYSRVLSRTGQKLALTCGAEGQPLTVTSYSLLPEQIWLIENYSDGRTQYVIPQAADNLQVNFFGDTNITLSPPGRYVWTIRALKDGFTIQDGGVSIFWGIGEGTDGEKVSTEKAKVGHGQRWILERID